MENVMIPGPELPFFPKIPYFLGSVIFILEVPAAQILNELPLVGFGGNFSVEGVVEILINDDFGVADVGAADGKKRD